MDKAEFANFCKLIKTAYSKEKDIFPNEQALEIWYAMLNDLPYNLAISALQMWISENRWSPQISDIRQNAYKICYEEEDADWGTGWQEVITAISRYGVHRPNEALASMSELTRKVVKMLGFTNLCMSENISVDRANFRRCYESLQEREMREKQLPSELASDIRKIKEQRKALLDVHNPRETDNQKEQHENGEKSEDRQEVSASLEAIQKIRNELSSKLGTDT